MSNEVRKAQEEVQVKNIKSIAEYSRATRAQVRDLEKQVNELKNMVVQQNQTIELQKATTMNLIQMLNGN